MSARRFLIAGAAALCIAGTASAQDRLVGLRALSGGGVFERIEFADGGLLQSPLVGQDSLRITSATQISFPVAASMPLGRSWTVDITTVYSSGEVGFTSGNSNTAGTATLSGLSDVRVRTTGRFFNDGLIFTAGLNAPTGKTELSALELTAVRVLSAPALALGASPIGAGPSGTVGLLSARSLGPWAVAAGVAYEHRGSYQPVAALVAGAPSADFQPGGVIRASLGLDRLIGNNRLSITAAGDFFQTDELRAPSGSAPIAQVRLGPVFSADAQLQLGVPRVRDFVLWTAARYRSNFSRDDITVDNSSGTYFDGGLRTTVPVARSTDVIFAVDGRFHSGLEIDEGLPTSGVTSGSATLGFSQRIGMLAFQPFARGTLGSVNARGNARDSQQANFTGVSLGLVIISRF